MDIFVGSLPFKLKENQLQELFEKFGEVTSAKIIIDKITRQNKGFGFVEMPNEDEALRAIEALNGSEVEGRTIVVNKSEKKEDNKRSFTDRSNTNSNRSFNSNDYRQEKESPQRTFRNQDKKKNDFKKDNRFRRRDD